MDAEAEITQLLSLLSQVKQDTMISEINEYVACIQRFIDSAQVTIYLTEMVLADPAYWNRIVSNLIYINHELSLLGIDVEKPHKMADTDVLISGILSYRLEALHQDKEYKPADELSTEELDQLKSAALKAPLYGFLREKFGFFSQSVAQRSGKKRRIDTLESTGLSPPL